MDIADIEPRPIPIGIGDAGIERHLYSPEIENWFKVEIEEPAQPVIDKLRATQIVKRSELTPLVRYILCQSVRTPLYRDHLKEYEPQRIISHLRRNGIDPVIHGYDQQRIRSMFEQRFGTLTLNVEDKTVDRCVAGMGWMVMRLSNFGEFITSDNPVCFWSTSPGHAFTGIIFPVSPKLTLVGSERNRVTFRHLPVGFIDSPFRVNQRRVREDVARYVNDTIASKAGRFLFGKTVQTLEATVRPRS